MELQGRIAVVTGGGVRVGRAICLALAEQGVAVFVHYNSSEGPAREVAKQIEAAGGTAAIGSIDLSDPSMAPELIDMAAAALGQPSILVNSASGFAADTIDTVTLAGLRESVSLTLESPVMLTQAFARGLGAAEEGAVVNITDVRTHAPYREHFSYMIAKGGVDTLTRAAALALAPRIRVNAVALGVILPPVDEGGDYALRLAESLPLAKVGGAGVVADTVVFLCRNDFITGEIVRVDGGGHLV